MKLDMNNNLFRMLMSDMFERLGYREVTVTKSVMDALTEGLFEEDDEPEITAHGYEDGQRMLKMNGIKFTQKPNP